jgi:hypothetical protein
MSAKNNVNPDHYKVAGRDRPNERIAPEVEKQKLALEAQEAEEEKALRRTEATADTAATDAADTDSKPVQRSR